MLGDDRLNTTEPDHRIDGGAVEAHLDAATHDAPVE
jgi:hypothetical protein